MPPKKRKRADDEVDYENPLAELAERLRTPLRSVASRTVVYCDIGTRNLSFAMVRQHGPIPKPSATIKLEDWLVQGKPVIELLLSYNIDLMSPSGVPHLDRYRLPIAEAMRNSVDMTLAKPYQFTPELDGPLHVDVPSIKAILLGKEWELENANAGGNFSVWNERMCQLVASPDMNWLFAEPYPLVIEPQCDQSKGHSSLVTARNHGVQHMLMAAIWTKDAIRFGVRRAIVLSAVKYGTAECQPELREEFPHLAAAADDTDPKKKEKREKAEYQLRKLGAVKMAGKLATALRMKSFQAHIERLPKEDDACESFTGALGYLEKTQRARPLGDADKAKCVAGVSPDQLAKQIQPPAPLTPYQKTKRSAEASDLDVALSRQFSSLEPLAKRRKLSTDSTTKSKKKQKNAATRYDDDYYFSDDDKKSKNKGGGGKSKVTKAKIDFTSFDAYND